VRSINEQLRIAYAAALTQIPDIGVYYQYLPNNKNPDNYIVFRSINNVDSSTKSTFETVTNITVEIHTRGQVGNRGLSADNVADEVLQLIYPSRQINLALDRGQIYNTQVSNDVTQDYSQQNQFGYISRFITFRHLIYTDGSNAGSGGTVIAAGAVFRIDYTADGGEVGFTNNRLQNKRIIDVVVDGISCAEIITSGEPIGKQALYDTVTGTITVSVGLEPNEKIFILYQLN